MGFLSDFFKAEKSGSKMNTREHNEKQYRLLLKAQRAANKGDIAKAERLVEKWEKMTGRRG
jgi:hypothetical protein